MRLASIAICLCALSAGASAATHVVTIEGMAFQPASLTVQRGDTVVWHNKDMVPHTATAAGKFDSKQIEGGKRWTWTATGAGRYDYVCLYHLGMKASLVVQ